MLRTSPGFRPSGAPGDCARGVLSCTNISPFTSEFMADVTPYLETTTDNPRTGRIAPLRACRWGHADARYRVPNLSRSRIIGVFSSGASLGGGRGAGTSGCRRGVERSCESGSRPCGSSCPGSDAAARWETSIKADLDNAALKKGRTHLVDTGVADGLIATREPAVYILKKHGFNPIFKESPGRTTPGSWAISVRVCTGNCSSSDDWHWGSDPTIGSDRRQNGYL